MKTENDNIIIPKWMINILHLTGTELLSFAEIFRATNKLVDEQSTFNSMFAELGISRSSFYRAREKLIEKGLISYIEDPTGTKILVTDKALAIAESTIKQNSQTRTQRAKENNTAAMGPVATSPKKMETLETMFQDEPKENSNDKDEQKAQEEKPNNDKNKVDMNRPESSPRQKTKKPVVTSQDDTRKKREIMSRARTPIVVNDKMYPQTLFDIAEPASESKPIGE